MGTFIEGCQNRKNNDFSENMKNKMLYYMKNHDGDSIALIYGLVKAVQYFIPLTSGNPEPHSFFFLSDLLTNFEVYIGGRVLLWFSPLTKTNFSYKIY